MEEKENVILVYLGMRPGGAKPIPIWLCVTEEQLGDGTVPSEDLKDDCYRSYSSKPAGRHLAGGVGAAYDVPQLKGTTRVYAGEARYRGHWPDDQKRAEWQLKHRTAVTAHELEKRRKKEGAEDNFAFLKPCRERYSKLISQDQRAALLAQVIAYITGGR